MVKMQKVYLQKAGTVVPGTISQRLMTRQAKAKTRHGKKLQAINPESIRLRTPTEQNRHLTLSLRLISFLNCSKRK